MKINLERLPALLKNSTAPIYLINGAEPLLLDEGSSFIRKQLHGHGFTERRSRQVNNTFDWNSLLEAMNSFSLFAAKSLLELRFPANKLNDAGKKALALYAKRPPEDKVLLLVFDKLDTRTQNSAWFKAIEKIGVCITVWPVSTQNLPAWIQKRLQKYNMSADSEAVRFIANRTEGNLLAAKQEIEKLYLLFDKKKLTLEDVIHAAANSSRFDIFDLADAVLAGNNQRTLRIIKELQEEGTEATLILWTLTKEIRTLINISEKLAQNQPLEVIMNELRIWEKQKPLMRSSLKRHKLKNLLSLLKHASQIDLMIKGISTDNAWDNLTKLALSLSISEQ